MSMEAIREQFPQYDDVPDEQLLRGVHAKHYSDMPFDEFAAKAVGEQATPTVAQDSLADDAVDVAAEYSAGANSAFMAVPDAVVDAVNLVGGGLKGLGRLALGGELSDAVADTQARPIPNASDIVEYVSGYRPGDGGYMEPGMARDAVRAFGQVSAPGGMAMTPVKGRNLATAPGVVAEVLGFGSAPAQQTARTIANTIDDSPPITAKGPDPSLPNNFPAQVVNDAPPPIRTPGGKVGMGRRVERNVARDMAIKRGEGSPIAAGFKLDDAGNVVKDAAQQKALKAGVEKRIVAQMAQAAPVDKKQATKMLRVVRRSLANKTYGDFNLPREVLGDSLHGRHQAVRIANKRAGKAVGEAVKELKDIPFNGAAYNQGPLTSFSESLKELGVTLKRGGGVDFNGSVFEGSPQARKVIAKTLKRLRNTEVTSLESAHNLKLFIDDMVDEYGKSSGGLSGRAERVVKNLRHDTNQFIREYAPAKYAEANDIFAETIEALDETQRLIGRNNDMTPRNLAKVARKSLSNYQNGDSVMDNIVELDRLARKYGSDFPDDLETQVSIVNTIERLFPSAKPANSLGGVVDSSLDFAKRAKDQGVMSAALDKTFEVGKKALGRADDKQVDMLEVLEALIKDSQAIQK